MSIKYERAPVYEVVAELRWLPMGAAPAQQLSSIVNVAFTDGGALESFYMRFAAMLFGKGFEQTERVIPPGFLTPTHQVALRVRNSKLSSPVLYQVGPGVFTSNALAPYDGWDSFSAFTTDGIATMLAARPEAERDAPISHMEVRYMNAFSDVQMKGLTPSQFMQNVLGFASPVPAAIAKVATAPVQGLQFTFQVPVADDLILAMMVIDGKFVSGGTGQALGMNLGVISQAKIAPTVEAISAVLDRAHRAAHDFFESLINPIRHELLPKE